MAVTEDVAVQIVADYVAGGCDVHSLAARYHCRKSTVSAVLRAAEVMGLAYQREWERRRNRPQRKLVNNAARLAEGITAPEWAYAAGCLDGEGTIGLSPTGYRVGVSQKDRSMLVWMQEHIGAGFIGKPGKKSAVSQWRLCSQKHVFLFLCGVRPYLTVKRREADEAIAYLAYRYKLEEACQQEEL